MRNKILVAPIFENKEFESEARSGGLAALTELAEVEGYTNETFTATKPATTHAVYCTEGGFYIWDVVLVTAETSSQRTQR